MRVKPERREATYHGPACGQTGTSTRQELTAWIQVLTLPIRSRYATDSKSMMDKALKLIDAAKVHELQQIDSPYGNRPSRPFKKTWKLQTDGDLWEQAWKAVLIRAAANLTVRKVKGHAASEDVAQGRATAYDKTGNDKVDKLADEGVTAIQGRGFAKLADWCTRRNGQYRKSL